MSKGRVVVVGGGLAGLMSTLKLTEAGVTVDLFSLVPVKRSHSVCAQGGINGAINTKGENDSPDIHFDDTIYGGDFLANQKPVKAMCEAAPKIIYLFDRMGVMFNRTPEGLIDLRRFGGTKHRRTAFAGATTGQQLMYALDEQVRRAEVNGLVNKYENWEFLSVVIDDAGVCRGIVAQNLRTMEIVSFPADAVIIATGGPGLIYGKSTNSTINTGYAAAKVYTQGAHYANGEFIQFHPTAVPGDDKNRLMSESARGEGGRIWTYKDGKPWYFLEEKYPAYGNLVPRDIAAREIFHVCVDLGLGIDGENAVYLDVSHIPDDELNVKLGGLLDIYQKFTGDDPRKIPMKIFPAPHYSMGGIWVDEQQMTNIPGLFAAGECDYSLHGANRLGANSLLSAVFGGMTAGPSALNYVSGLEKTAEAIPASVFERELRRETDAYEELLRLDGTENAFALHDALGRVMTSHVGVVRENKRLRAADEQVEELMARFAHININDTTTFSNSSVSFARQLKYMLQLARIVAQGAYLRNESRGSHYKPEYPERDDDEWLKTTIATYNSKKNGPEFSYEAVDTSLIAPRKRDYSVDKKEGK